jgi:hypothetical protein
MSTTEGASQIVSDGLIFYLDAANPTSYPGTGTNFFNLGSNLYNSGSLQGVTYVSSNNGSMFFNGDGVFIQIPAINSSKFASQFTLNFWTKPTNLGLGTNIYLGLICNIGGNSGNTNRFLLDNDFNQFLFQLIPQGGTEINILSNTFTSIQNQITMCSLTYNSATSSSVFYVNGTNVGSSTLFSGSISTGSSSPTIGWGSTVGGAYYFSGSMYSIQMYDRALSQPEIQQNYRAHYRRIFGNSNINP